MRIFVILFIIISSKANATGEIHQILSKAAVVKIQEGKFILPNNGESYKHPMVLLGIQHEYKASTQKERIIFSFAGKNIPSTFGYKNGNNFFLDLYKVKIKGALKQSGKGRNVSDLKIFYMDDEFLSIEIAFKENPLVGVFYTQEPNAQLIIEL